LVTGVTSDGFYLQDPVGDGDPATSDAIFAYTHDTPTERAGECLQVAGEVDEYYDKSELNWITTATPSQACGAQAITPVVLPTIEPGADPISTLEPLEGMVVQLPPLNGFVYEPTKRF
jgi:predicted extracellular nuclease